MTSLVRSSRAVSTRHASILLRVNGGYAQDAVYVKHPNPLAFHRQLLHIQSRAFATSGMYGNVTDPSDKEFTEKIMRRLECGAALTPKPARWAMPVWTLGDTLGVVGHSLLNFRILNRTSEPRAFQGYSRINQARKLMRPSHWARYCAERDIDFPLPACCTALSRPVYRYRTSRIAWQLLGPTALFRRGYRTWGGAAHPDRAQIAQLELQWSRRQCGRCSRSGAAHSGRARVA